jgi:DNA-binding MarR family transcriptional regulator
MLPKPHTPDSDREMLTLLGEISAGLRCCRQDVFNCEGLGLSQFLILDQAAGRDELPMAELHRRLDLDKSTVTRLVGPMLSRGLLTRRKSAADGRAASLVITANGRETLAKVWDCVRGYLAGLLAAIPPERQGQTLACLKDFALALRRGAAQACAGPQPVNDLSKEV